VFEFKLLFEFICLNVFEKWKTFSLYPSNLLPFWPVPVSQPSSTAARAEAQPSFWPSAARLPLPPRSR
jgi:hypothetical protein